MEKSKKRLCEKGLMAGLAMVVFSVLFGCETIGKGNEEGFLITRAEGKTLSALGLDMR